MMKDMRKLAGIAGIVFVVLAAVTFLLPGQPPAIEDPNSDWTEFFTDNRSAILWAQWLGFLLIIPASFFVGYFVMELRRMEGGMSARSLATLISFAVLAGIATIFEVVFAVAAFEAKHTLTDDSARLLADLGALLANAQLATTAAVGLFSGWAIIDRKGMAAWVGWLGILTGVVNGVASAGLASDGNFAPGAPAVVLPAVGLLLLYVLGISVEFLRTPAGAEMPMESGAMARG